MTIVSRPELPLSHAEQKTLARVGYAPERERAATAVVVDREVAHIDVEDPSVEVLPIAEALVRHEWVQDLLFGLVRPDSDERLARAVEQGLSPVGHFVHVAAGARVRLPVQTFTMLETPQAHQYVHCLTVIEEGAELEAVSGSAAADPVRRGSHLSVSENYLRPGAKYRSVSIEHWGEEMEVASFGATEVGVGAVHADTAIMLSPVARHETVSTTILHERAVSTDESIVFAAAGTERISTSRIELDGEGAHAESIARMVTGGGIIRNRSTLVGRADGSDGYLGCDGLKIGREGFIESSPGLIAHSPASQLSHEASIGMITRDKLAYLMATGLDEDAARDLIVRGFLQLDRLALPEHIAEEVRRTVAEARSGAL